MAAAGLLNPKEVIVCGPPGMQVFKPFGAWGCKN